MKTTFKFSKTESGRVKNFGAEDYSNTDDNVETKAVIQETDEFTENHQQANSNKNTRQEKKYPKKCRRNAPLQVLSDN